MLQWLYNPATMCQFSLRSPWACTPTCAPRQSEAAVHSCNPPSTWPAVVVLRGGHSVSSKTAWIRTEPEGLRWRSPQPLRWICPPWGSTPPGASCYVRGSPCTPQSSWGLDPGLSVGGRPAGEHKNFSLWKYIFFVITIPNSRSLCLETVNYS